MNARFQRHLLKEHRAFAMVSGNQTGRGLVAQYGTIVFLDGEEWEHERRLERGHRRQHRQNPGTRTTPAVRHRLESSAEPHWCCMTTVTGDPSS